MVYILFNQIKDYVFLVVGNLDHPRLGTIIIIVGLTSRVNSGIHLFLYLQNVGKP